MASGPRSSSSSSAVGAILDGRWQLTRLVARGETGVLYAAEDHILHHFGSVLLAPTEHRDALFKEARLRDRAAHPSIVPMLDVGLLPKGGGYLALAPLTGRSLDGLLVSRGSLPPDEAVEIALGLADALAHLETLGLAHGSLSPSSVLVDGTRTRLLDLGALALPVGAVTGPLASFPFTAPERLQGAAPAGPRTEVYAVCAILAEMLGARVAEGDDVNVLPLTPATLDVLRAGLATDPEKRIASPGALGDAMREALVRAALPPSTPPPSRREHPRVPYLSALRVQPKGADRIDGRIENVSEGGMLVIANGRVEVGMEVLVRFTLPVSGRVVSEPAVVQWVRGAEGAPRAFGLRFESPTERTVEDLRRYADHFERDG